jgi:hypothetical protein
LDALRHLSYAEEQLEHAIRRAEDEGKEVSVLQWDKDLGSAPVERDEKVLPGVRKLPLERWECNDEMGGDFKMESAKELHIEALIEDELDRIVKEHGLFSSDHEAWAVIKEEIDEAYEDIRELETNHAFWWKRIRDDDIDNLDVVDEIEKYSIEAIKELVQVIACCRKWKQGHLKDWVESKAVKV